MIKNALNSAPRPHTLVILLFRLKLIRVHLPHRYILKDLLAEVLYSGKHDLPAEIETIMQPYKPRNLRFFTPHFPLPIHDLNSIPDSDDLKGLLMLDADTRSTISCAGYHLPSDGSCLNLVVEEPLPIEEHSEEGRTQLRSRFRSREAIVYLNQHNIELKFTGLSAGIGYLGEEENQVWCKLIGEGELETFRTLEPLNPSAHHIVALLLPPHHLPTGQYLITMPDYGHDLNWVSMVFKERLAGTRIRIIAHQLCEAIQFLHSNNLYHLDIKPQNLTIDHHTSNLTVIDLGWVMYAPPPCVIEGPAGTSGLVAPEVQRWFDWEETEDGDPPPFYNPQKADAWAIGNVIRILLDKADDIVGEYLLEPFSEWMMDERPSMDTALAKLEDLFYPPMPTRSTSALDSTDISFSSSPLVKTV
ncbi:hypothetical protein E1B28_009382 [Marasmius oreades]|uniref:Protein kinase domain-containing protein n=1 Tax=Marasmius oreades TaxID=181124 RepID=A0A9P7UTD2_9AGAR|nr:uncharacterized protein E1B28_009382 [Marasmius oreades]KAG7093095.1 hypothetical protein E1B28_009382 [Marasmius oreades]